jgi:ATP-dependent DNA ligase
VKYGKLAETYERLESTQKTLEKTDILAEFFSESGEDLERVVLLVNGKIYPEWNKTEIGLSSQMMKETISEATGHEPEKVEELWRDKGDLGLAAEELVGDKKQQKLVSQDLTVESVLERLRKVAEMEKEGMSESVSQDKKRGEIADLISSAEPIEARYLVRTVLGHLRIGVAEGTIRDALSEAFFNGEHTEKIQTAYDFTNDFAEVAEACRKGIEDVEKLDLELFRPVNSMLARKVDTIEEGFDTVGKPAAIDYKYDGMRCISGHTPIYVEGKGVTSVKDVDVGEKVLTHKGHFKKVKETNKRQIESDEKVFRFSTYLGNDFKITEGHEVLTEDGWMNVEDLDKKTQVIFPLPEIKSDEKPPERLSFQRKGGYTKTIEINNDFWRFVGFWIGDGYSNKANGNQRIGLVFNEKEEKELLGEYQQIALETLLEPEDSISTHKHNGGKTLYWTDPPLLEWISKNFRKQTQNGWKDKKIPEWFWNLSEEEFRNFLEGWIEADGQKEKNGDLKNVTTKEKTLATQAQLLAAKHGIECGIKKLRKEDKTYYKLRFTSSDRNAVIEDEKMKVRILKKEELSRSSPREVDPRQTVYNLQVEDDESYCTTTVALHNCQIHKKGEKTKLFTRRLEDVTKQFPDVVEAVKDHIDAENCILDTEIVGYNPEDGSMIEFQKLSKRIKRKYEIQKLKKEIPVEVRPFDLIYLDEPILEKPYRERLEQLEDIVEDEERELQMVDHEITDEEERVQEMQQKSLSNGQEGIMMKNLDAEYKPGSRVGYMVKLKPVMETLDLAIIAAEWGEGERAGWFGSLFLGCYNEETGEYEEVGKMATGLTEEQLEEVTERLKPLIEREDGRKVFVRPEIIVEAEYEEIQQSPTYSSGYALRFPRLKSFRDDKEEADSMDKVESIYEDQK